MASVKAIIAAIDKVIVVDARIGTELHADVKIDGYFRPSGRNDVETVFVEASGRLGKIEFSVTKTETVKYEHDAAGDIVKEFTTGSKHSVGGNNDLDVRNALRLIEMAGYKFRKENVMRNNGTLAIVEKFGRQAEHVREKVENGTDCLDFRDVYYFLDNEEVYNAGYRSGGTWVDGWWS